MRRTIVKAVVLMLCVAAASGARAATFNVGAARKDKTLNAVLPRLKPGDIVQIDAGVYRETARLTMNGTRVKPITIRGVGASRAIFDAEGFDTSGRRTRCRAPKTWKLLGTNDGHTWATLDERNQTITDTSQLVFNCANPGAYRILRLQILTNNGDPYTGVRNLIFTP